MWNLISVYLIALWVSSSKEPPVEGWRKKGHPAISCLPHSGNVSQLLTETYFHETKRKEMGSHSSISNQTAIIWYLNFMEQQSWCQTGLPLFTWWRCPFVKASDFLTRWLSGCIITLSESEAPVLRLGPACLLREHIELGWLSAQSRSLWWFPPLQWIDGFIAAVSIQINFFIRISSQSKLILSTIQNGNDHTV